MDYNPIVDWLRKYMEPEIFAVCGYTYVATRGYYCLSNSFYDDMRCISLHYIGFVHPKDTADLYDWLNSHGYMRIDKSDQSISRMLDTVRRAHVNIPMIQAHTVSATQRATMLKLSSHIQYILSSVLKRVNKSEPSESDANTNSMSVDELLFGRGCA